jgi:3,4-dihydroxyphenylacetate 2,3-dioxygenase
MMREGAKKMGIVGAGVTAHVPRMASEERAPAFQRGLIAGSKAMGEAISELKPDLLVVQSAHWVCSFNWYATVQDPHHGICVADEAPDLIPGIAYHRKGDAPYARQFIAALQKDGLPAFPNSTPHYQWDYAALVPLLYLDPDAELPVVQIPTVLAADLTECMRAGRALHEAAVTTGRRVVFLASCALSHEIARGPSLWPSEARMALDKRLIELLETGNLADLKPWFPTYCKDAVAEMGGRVLATLLGTLEAMTGEENALSGHLYGDYAQSSGSGNANVLVARTS